MTATINPPAVQAADPELDPLRLLPIAANLLPPEITDARRAKKIRRVVAGIVGGALVLTAGWYVLAQRGTSDAQQSLTSAQDKTRDLTRQEAKYSDLVKIRNQTSAISTELKTLMTNDLPWWQLLPALRAAAPAGVVVTSVNGTMTPSSGAGAVATSAPIPGTTTAVGALTLVGTAPDKNSIAAFVDTLTKVNGVTDVYLTSAQSQTGATYQYTITMGITNAALGGRYSTATATPTGGTK